MPLVLAFHGAETAIQPAGGGPDGIAVSANGTVWIADTGTDQITALTVG
jgi:streptogramin lyase